MDAHSNTPKSLHEIAISHGLPGPGDSDQLFWIPDVNLDALTARIEWLNGRAEKLDATPIVIDVIGHYSYTDKKHKVHYFTSVFVVGSRIKLAGGYRFVGTLEHAPDGNILRAVPGESIPLVYRTVDPTCDHCQLERRRKDTYIVASEDDQYLQVGKTCLKDFVGHRSPAAIAAWAEYLADLAHYIEEEYFDLGGSPTGIDAVYYLTLVAASIRLWGWTSRSKASDMGLPATADNALYWADEDIKTLAPNHALKDKNGLQEYTRAGKPVETESADLDLAKAAMVWAADLEGDAIVESDYLWNLHIVAQSDGFTWRQVGLAASMIFAYQRHVNDLAEKLARGNGKPSIWVGDLKKRQQFDHLELVAVFSWESMYGVTFMHKFCDVDGNIIVWKTGSVCLDQGSIYAGKATVKAHDTYKDEKQTVVTRATLGRIEENGN